MTFDFEARHIIEALRSGVPSRAVGRYFSEARPLLMKEIIGNLNEVHDEGVSKGMIVSGKYGEGKTHLLNTVFSLAQANNMVVSFLSLSKETPFDKLYLVYQKVVNNTYLPKSIQPGFSKELERLTPNSPITSEMLLFAARQLETDRLYYVLRSYLNTDDQEEQFLLQTDLEGDFIANVQIRKIYRRIFQEKIAFTTNFVKTKHCRDYFAFLSHLFRQLGYDGWVIMFDEAELMGRLGKKARMKAYANMADFLMPARQLDATFSLFAFSASYNEDVIEGKHEYENFAELCPEEQEPMSKVLDAVREAPQLKPLNNDEVRDILRQLIIYHGRAYGWEPQVREEDLFRCVDNGGYLLRSKIRTAIEYLDQVYLYGEAGKSSVKQVAQGNFTEDQANDMPALDNLLEN